MNVKRRTIYNITWAGDFNCTQIACSSFKQALEAAEKKFPTRKVDGVRKTYDAIIYVVV